MVLFDESDKILAWRKTVSTEKDKQVQSNLGFKQQKTTPDLEHVGAGFCCLKPRFDCRRI
jgi:hypothetical protein